MFLHEEEKGWGKVQYPAVPDMRGSVPLVSLYLFLTSQRIKVLATSVANTVSYITA